MPVDQSKPDGINSVKMYSLHGLSQELGVNRADLRDTLNDMAVPFYRVGSQKIRKYLLSEVLAALRKNALVETPSSLKIEYDQPDHLLVNTTTKEGDL